MLYPYAVDLFGEVPVTHEDVSRWLIAVPRLDPESPRAAYYVQAWDVPGKIRAAKLAGTFEAIVSDPRPAPSPFWWRRMRWT